MAHVPYIGSGPYCYANSFAMMFGDRAPSTAVIEFAAGGPFGMQLVGGTLPFFDPYGWTPEAGFDGALAALGWASSVRRGGTAEQALAALAAALADGPVWVGPVEMGHLRHQPGMTGPIGADHYVVVIGVAEGQVLMHDPQGYPYVTLPVDDFVAAWRAESVDYATPFTLRTGFRQLRAVPEEEAIEASLPAALRWLAMVEGRHLPAGTVGNAEAAERLAGMIEAGCDRGLRSHLVDFAVQVGARRVADAASCLARIGRGEAARIMDGQARLIGALQHPLVTGDDAAAAALLRALAPSYAELSAALQAG
ncbi:hypothetical protein [Inquilinus sp. Marseille-Q2685]|uniref:hypothetical protein n=1 Tax=Inquilinus sp. Marseille-Q2685 TaxID=2866581 RepID=UPI001CE403B3|nr:hypothetical protein [Inquilinus sp. Marseille-Q2685]